MSGAFREVERMFRSYHAWKFKADSLRHLVASFTLVFQWWWQHFHHHIFHLNATAHQVCGLLPSPRPLRFDCS